MPRLPNLLQPALTERQANQTVQILRAAEAECASKPVEYRVDCLRYGLRDATRKLSRQNEWRGDNQPLVRELQALQQDLKRLVDANADRSAPRIPVRNKKLQVVKRSSVSKVNSAARARIAETETRLLRSSGAGTRAQFTKVAQALGSTKKILRS